MRYGSTVCQHRASGMTPANDVDRVGIEPTSVTLRHAGLGNVDNLSGPGHGPVAARGLLLLSLLSYPCDFRRGPGLATRRPAATCYRSPVVVDVVGGGGHLPPLVWLFQYG